MKGFLPSILRQAGIAPQTSLEVDVNGNVRCWTSPPHHCGSCGMSFRRAPCPENGEWTVCGMCCDHFWHVERDGVVVCGVTEN